MAHARSLRRLLTTTVLAAALAAGSALVVAGATPASAATGTLRGTNSGRCLDVANGNAGTRAQLWDCNNATNQRWTTTGSRQIQVFGNKCLEAWQHGVTPGTPVTIWDCTGGLNQQWNVMGNGTIVGVQSGLCLDPSNNGTANGTLIQLWTCTTQPDQNPQPNQKWSGLGSNCPSTGKVTYTFVGENSPTAEQRDRITTAMNQATGMYNCYTNITKALTVKYANVPTADGNINGTIRFGSAASMVQATAMHEIAHTVGVGTHGQWNARRSGNDWNGANANNLLRSLTGDNSALMHADGSHFWPYGLNLPSEVKSQEDYIRHCKLVVALRKDMGEN